MEHMGYKKWRVLGGDATDDPTICKIFLTTPVNVFIGKTTFNLCLSQEEAIL